MTLARVSVDFHPEWPIDDISDASRGFVYQTVPGVDSSLVFVRWGPEETLENYIRPLGHSGWTATLQRDEAVTHAGLAARRVRILLAPLELSDHDDAQPLILVVTGLVMCGLPLLFGYRLPEDAFPEWESRMEGIVGTVRCG